MCLSPKYITNRTLHYTLFQPLKLQVPCGKCEECRSANRNEWFTRCYFEWLRNRNSTYFYTLTYNNDNVPRFNGFTCFSKRHLQAFLKRLRYVLYKRKITFKYMICCEYGEKFNRSHYHMLLFLSREINPYILYHIIEKTWSYGFVNYAKNAGVVNSSSGIQYVTKYVTKDFMHLRNVILPLSKLVFNRYYKLFHYVCKRRGSYPPVCFTMNFDGSFSRKILDNCEQSDLDFVQLFLTKMRREVNKFLPFHIQSSKLGSNIIDSCEKDIEKCFVIDYKGRVQASSLPRYIKRMLWYDVVESETTGKKSRYVLNDEGKKHFLTRISLQVQHDVDAYKDTILNISSCPSELLGYFSVNHLEFGFTHIRDVIHWAQHFDLDLEVLSIYKNVFRGRLNFFHIDNLTSQYIKDSYMDVVEHSLYALPNMDFGAISKDFHLVTNLSTILWNNHVFFQVYEHALQILESIMIYRNSCRSSAKLEQEEKSRKLREIINNV